MSNVKTAKHGIGRTLKKSSILMTNAVHMNVSAESLNLIAERIQKHSEK